jgi:ADP-ribose pyrophosphatase YjhB (NUDIX family)
MKNKNIGNQDFYKKIESFGNGRIIGSGKNISEQKFLNFGYDKETGFLLIDNNSKKFFSILDKDLSSYYIKEYISSEFPDFKIELIPEQFYFNEQNTTDTILFKTDEHGDRQYAFIFREFPPYGYALAGGMVDENEDSLEANFRELKEELNADDISLDNDFGYIKNYEIRGSLNTRLISVEANNPSQIEAGDDANSFIWLSENDVNEFINSNKIIPHHQILFKKFLNSKKDNSQKLNKSSSCFPS